jgi:hypothetical protein
MEQGDVNIALGSAIINGLNIADVSISADITTGDDDALELYLRYQDFNNYYKARLSYFLDNEPSFISIIKKVTGTETQVSTVSFVPFTPGAPFAATFEASGNTLTVKINGITRLTTVDSSISAAGTCGVGTIWMDHTVFDNVQVSAIATCYSNSGCPDPDYKEYWEDFNNGITIDHPDTSLCLTKVISGCTAAAASNYNEDAQISDSSCLIYGCTDPSYDNYNPAANFDDETCEDAS